MKKFLSLLLALTLVFALVACSSEKDTSSEGDTSTTTQTENTDTTDTQTSETNTNESLSDTVSPSASTPTTSTKTSELTTSNKVNTTSSKQNNTTSTSTTPSSPTTSKPTTSKEPTLPSSQDWIYKNGGYDYIIKYRGNESVKIQLDMSKLPPEIEQSTGGTTTYTINRYNFICSDNYIFFCQIIYREYKTTNNSDDSIIGYFPREYVCKIKKDGTGYVEIGVPNSEFGHRNMLGYKDGYMYCMLGADWAPYGDVYKIKISDSLYNITDSCEYLFDGGELFDEDWGDIAKSNIIGNYIYYTVELNSNHSMVDYKIKTDGTGLQKIK